MTTFNTGNPIGSKDPRDLYDNAENLDEAVNTRTEESWDDRFGVARKTWWGMEQDFQNFLINSGYQNIGDYAAGLEITARNQTFWRDGELYRAGASLELPYTTTGDWGDEEGLFVAVGDASLRQELADPSLGGELIHVTTSTGEQTLADSLDDRAAILSSSLTVRIPSDFPTLQEAIDALSTLSVRQGENINLMIESGYRPDAGVVVTNGDYSKFLISSEDPVVELDESFSGTFVSSSYCRAPILNCLVDSRGFAERGFSILGGFGKINPGCGVMNVTNEGLWAYHSVVHAGSSIWSGSGDYAMRMSRGTIFNAPDSDCSNSKGGQNGIIYCNRGSIGNVQGTNLSGCQAQKILYAHRASKLNAHHIVADGCIIDDPTNPFSGFAVAARVSELDINSSTVTNLNGKFISAIQGGSVNASSMADTVTDGGNGDYNCIENRSGRVLFEGTIVGFSNHLSQSGGYTDIGNSVLNQPGQNGITATDGAVVKAQGIEILNAGANGIVSRYGAQVIPRFGSVKGSGVNDLSVVDGAYIYATNCETTNGAGGPDIGDTNLPGGGGFNFSDNGSRGFIWA